MVPTTKEVLRDALGLSPETDSSMKTMIWELAHEYKRVIKKCRELRRQNERLRVQNDNLRAEINKLKGEKE